jgi:hypothetical protein
VPELLIRSAAHGYYDIDPQAQRSAGFLAVVVVIVLLIVCANVANLLLSRATSRHREISVRLSMGATRGRLVRQLLTESVLLSSLGGVLGVLIGYWSRALLPFGEKAPLDWRVFGFVAGVSLLTGIVFGLLPALRATGVDLAGAMKDSSRSVTGSRTLLSKALVVVQVAMSVVLLVGAGLFLRTLDNLKSVDVGFDSKNLLMFNVNPGVNRYDPERSAQVFHRVLERMASLPGVTAAALTRTTLLSDAGPDVADRRRREHVHDGRLAGVLRDAGDPGAAGPGVHRPRRHERAQGGDPQRGGGAHALRRRRRPRPAPRRVVREVRRVRDRRRGA